MNGEPVERYGGRLDDGTTVTVARYTTGRMTLEIAGPRRYAVAAMDAETLHADYESTRLQLVPVDGV